MFTGIIEEVGTVAASERLAADRVRLTLRCHTVVQGVVPGDSIAVDGCCVTVTSLPGDGFTVDLMDETLRVTTLGGLAEGDPVNLERAMRLGDRLDGHLVQGHVDGVGEVVGRVVQEGTTFLELAAPPEVGRYLVPKGSVTVGGASLTVVDVQDDPEGGGAARFRVGLIPHTLEVTTFDTAEVGTRWNLEADAMAKYAERLLEPYRA